MELTKRQITEVLRSGTIAKLLFYTHYLRSEEELINLIKKYELIKTPYTLMDEDCETVNQYPQYLTLYHNYLSYEDIFTGILIRNIYGVNGVETLGKENIHYDVVRWYMDCLNNGQDEPFGYISKALSPVYLLINRDDWISKGGESTDWKLLPIETLKKRVRSGVGAYTINTDTEDWGYDSNYLVWDILGAIKGLTHSTYANKEELLNILYGYHTYFTD